MTQEEKQRCNKCPGVCVLWFHSNKSVFFNPYLSYLQCAETPWTVHLPCSGTGWLLTAHWWYETWRGRMEACSAVWPATRLGQTPWPPPSATSVSVWTKATWTDRTRDVTSMFTQNHHITSLKSCSSRIQCKNKSPLPCFGYRLIFLTWF